MSTTANRHEVFPMTILIALFLALIPIPPKQKLIAAVAIGIVAGSIGFFQSVSRAGVRWDRHIEYWFANVAIMTVVMLVVAGLSIGAVALWRRSKDKRQRTGSGS